MRLPSLRDEDKFSVSKDILSEPARGRQEAEAGKESEDLDDCSYLNITLPPSAPPGHAMPGGLAGISVGPFVVYKKNREFFSITV